MDTLAIGADDRLPLSFQRKFLPVPERDLLIAGTGHAGFINAWFEHYQSHHRDEAIDKLDSSVPLIFRSSVEAEGGLSGQTVTIYHFGYSSAERRYVGYAYRSERDFHSERLPDGLGFKPVIQIAATDDIRFPEFLVNIAIEQQHHDNRMPLEERVGIGGEIEFVVMSDRTIQVETVYRFSSYEREVHCIERRTAA